MSNNITAHKQTATRFIEAFNSDDWDTVREVVAPNYVFHHPVGGTVHAGPEGMVTAWSDFKRSLPDSWHPIPIMIAEGDLLAVLLPTYGHFTGPSYHGAEATGGWLEYGMVNIVRFEDGKLAENWFGMDPIAERQQMGAAPSPPSRQLTPDEEANLELFRQGLGEGAPSFDNLTAFGNMVIALGPPQHDPDARTRRIDVLDASGGKLQPIYSHEFTTSPPYPGDTSTDAHDSRAVVDRFYQDVLLGHDLTELEELVSPHILIHPTAMPCEATYYGAKGATAWLSGQWRTFPNLTITDCFTLAQGDIVAAHWTARGTASGRFLMLPPTGKTVGYTGSSMYRIEKGRIAEIWEARNTIAIMRQMSSQVGQGQHGH